MLEKPRDRFEDSETYSTWDEDYYAACFDKFYDAVIDLVIKKCRASKTDRWLDAGCGPGVHTIRFLKRGYKCESIDFSQTAIAEAKLRVNAAGYEGGAEFFTEDLTRLSYPDNAFSQIFCWGVITHIPEPQRAISELSRILKPGGWLAISTVNAKSFDRFLLEQFAYKLKKPKTLKRLGTTDMGRFAIFEEKGRELFVQGLFMDKVKEAFEANGAFVSSCIGTQPTELYTLVRSGTVNSIISWLNVFWLKYVRIPHLCADHLYFVQKSIKG